MHTFKLKAPTHSVAPLPAAIQQILGTAAPEVQDLVANINRKDRPIRAVGQLRADPKFMLPGREIRSKFMYFYNNLYATQFMPLMVLTMLGQIYLPGIVQVNLLRGLRPEAKRLVKNIYQEQRDGAGLLSDIGLKKEADGFRVRVPVCVISESAGKGLLESPIGMAGHVLSGVGGLEIMQGENQTIREAINKAVPLLTASTYDIGTFQPTGALSQADITNFQACQAQFIIEPSTGSSMRRFSFEFFVSKKEAEYLTNSRWIELRQLDLFNLIYSWAVLGRFGRTHKPPKFGIPMSRISAGIPSDIKGRSGELGITISERAEYYILPDKLDNIQTYEDQMIGVLTRPSGWFKFSPDEDETPESLVGRKLPSSMPVLVDWYNSKFVYTTNTGQIETESLDQFSPCSLSQIHRFLQTAAVGRFPTSFISIVLSIARQTGESIGSLDPEIIIKTAAAHYDLNRDSEEPDLSLEEVQFYHLFLDVPASKLSSLPENSSERVLGTFTKCAKSVLTVIEKNPTNAYALYTTLTVLRVHAALRMFVTYGNRRAELNQADRIQRKSYIEQKEDPGYELPAVPFIIQDPNQPRGALPHQVKVLSTLKDSPDNAIVEVDAGGGKTPMAIYDVLSEISRAPAGLRLVMCPGHLVSTYIKEYSYFTGSRVNIIPVVASTIRRHGFERLQAMIVKSPPNTVVITDYNVITLKTYEVAYGSASSTFFPVVNFLRQFDFSYVFCDESHYLRSSSRRAQAAARLIIDIKKKRLASGTFVSDVILDVVRQVALMDPTVFGSVSDFIDKYALETRGSKVTKWKPGAELLVKQAMKQNVVMATAKRKEWAALLPKPKEEFHVVALSEKLQAMYRAIMEEQMAKLAEEAQNNQKLAALLRGETEDENGDPLDMEGLLKPYLARMERFLSAPGFDPIGSTLEPEEAISPKVAEVVRLCKMHLDQKLPGKILIFTNYVYTAEAVINGLKAAGLGDTSILYTAGAKEECGAEFEKNPAKMIMAGVSSSMDTGLNLQHASRLIRTETVWTPGTLEQGNSRVGRPSIKDKEKREFTYFDWIVADKTIDITKVSYLIAKIISKAKYDEAGNPRFDQLEVPPLFTMRIEAITEANSWDDTLSDYFRDYQEYRRAVQAEYNEYREANRDKLLDENGVIKMQVLKVAKNPEASAVMLRVPYVPGTELYKAKDLGLVRYDDYMRIEIDEDESDEEDESEDESEDSLSDQQKAKLAAERQRAIGLGVHTDKGDGEIIRIASRRVTVLLASGEKIRAPKLATFVITRANTSGKDIRTQLLKLQGGVPLDEPIDVLETKITPEMKKDREKHLQKKLKETKQEVVEEEAGLELEFTVVNDFLGLRLKNLDDPTAVAIAQNYGFTHAPPYYMAQIIDPKQIFRVFTFWTEAGFSIDPDGMEECKQLYLRLRNNRIAAPTTFGLGTEFSLRNFYRTKFRPNPKKNHVSPFPVIQDGYVYIALPKVGQPGSIAGIRALRAMGRLKWFESDGAEEMVLFVNTKAKASQVIQRMISDGVNLRNIEEMKREFKKLRASRN